VPQAPAVTARPAAVSVKPSPKIAPAKPKLAPVRVAKAAIRKPAPKPSNQLTTVSGTVYNDVFVEKVNPTGIVISYTLHGGGMGMTEIDVSDLPVAVQRKYKIFPASSESQ
jgi:hypothetical protein